MNNMICDRGSEYQKNCEAHKNETKKEIKKFDIMEFINRKEKNKNRGELIKDTPVFK